MLRKQQRKEGREEGGEKKEKEKKERKERKGVEKSKAIWIRPSVNVCASVLLRKQHVCLAYMYV